MILINCPHCGERNEGEFLYGGDIEHQRPKDPDALSDADWCDYIYCVPNTKGWAIRVSQSTVTPLLCQLHQGSSDLVGRPALATGEVV